MSSTIVLALLGEILAVVFVARILTREMSPAATLLWVLVILATPYLGILLYYLLPRRIHLARLKRRADRLSWLESSLDEVAWATPSAEPDPTPLGRLLRRMDPDAIRGGNRLSLLATGPEFLAAARSALAQASHFVHLETYMFRPDATGLGVLAELARAAARGIEVRLLYDSLGSWSLKRRHLEGLRAAGGKAAPYLPVLWRHRPFTLNFRNHRKLLIVDGHTAILGGRNVGDEYVKDRFGKARRRWLDAMLEIHGPAVRRLHRVFIEDWYNAAEEDLARPSYLPEVEPAGEDTVGIVASGPDRRKPWLQWVLLQMISMAERSLELSSPYLVPDPVLSTALAVAASRGVRVRIHTNGRESENFVLHSAQRSFYGGLLAAGVRITETIGDYVHAKMILVDDRWLLIGSPNLDRRSTELNFELSAIAVDSAVCEEASALFARRVGEGREVTSTDLRSSPFAPVFEGMCRLASPLL